MMNKNDETEKIIKEFRDSKEQIRKIISDYEAQEFRLFKIMLDRLQQIKQYNSTDQNNIRSEQHRPLD